MWHKAEGVEKEGKIKQIEKENSFCSQLVGDLKSILGKRFSDCDQEAEKQEIVWNKQIHSYFLLLFHTVLTQPRITADYATLLIQKYVTCLSKPRCPWQNYVVHNTFSSSLLLQFCSSTCYYLGTATANYICELGTTTIDSKTIVFTRLQNSKCVILSFC